MQKSFGKGLLHAKTPVVSVLSFCYGYPLNHCFNFDKKIMHLCDFGYYQDLIVFYSGP